MKIFICWSSQRGLRVAEGLARWLHELFGDRIQTQVSSGIDKGVLWREKLQQDLDDSQVGLLCVTPEALRSQWVNYEAGMLARGLGVINPSERGKPGGPTKRLFTFLLGVEASDLDGPLAAFQSADGTDKADTLRLAHALCDALAQGEGAGDFTTGIDESWCFHWQRLNDEFAVIPKLPLTEVWAEFASLFRRKTFEEPIADCISQDWLARYNGARDTTAAIASHLPRVESACRRYVVELLLDLAAATDGYAMAMSRLVGRERFEIDSDGKLQITPKGLELACERWRARVLHLVMRAADPGQAPFFDESAHFERLERFTERENLVHRMMPLVHDFAGLVNALPTDRGQNTANPSAASQVNANGDAAQPEGKVAPRKCPVASNSIREWPEAAACFRLVCDALRANIPPAPLLNSRKVDIEVQFRTTDWDFDRIMYAVYLKERLGLSPTCEALPRSAIEFAETTLDRARFRLVSLAHHDPAAAQPIAVGSAATMQLWFALDAIDAVNPSTLNASKRLLELRPRVQTLSKRVLEFVKQLGCPHELVTEQALELHRRWSHQIDAAGKDVPPLENEPPASHRMVS